MTHWAICMINCKIKEHNNHMHSDSKKRRGFRYASVAPLFAAGDVKRSATRKEYPLVNLLEQHDLLLREKIAAMAQGTESGLVAIFGSDWEKIGSSGQRKEFGRLFKAAVAKKMFPEIEWVRIENSGRYDVYRKL